MTFSILARCPTTKEMGMAISSSSPAVAARCAFARAGAGVVATQNITDPALGPRGLDFLAGGLSARETLAALLENYHTAPWRQILVLDGEGRAAVHSGEHTLGIHATATGIDCVAGGNLLAGADIPIRMVEGFETASGALGDRLLAALQAGLAAGGEAGPVHACGLYIVRNVSWPVADLRVDWQDENPIEALAKLWALYRPQLEDYVTRAIDPVAAPSYGVPGDPLR